MTIVQRFFALALVTLSTVTPAGAASCPDQFSQGVTTAYCPEPSLPDWVRAKGEAFLSAATDAAYAKSKYKLNSKVVQAEHSDSCDGPVMAYALQYQYSALTAVGAEPDAVGVRVPGDAACEATGQVAAKDSGGAVVEPQVARARAIAIATERVGPKQAALESTAYLLLTPPGDTGPPWQWNVSLSSTPPDLKESEPACWPVYRIVLDAVSGAVISMSEQKTCT